MSRDAHPATATDPTSDTVTDIANDTWYRDERAFASEAAHRILNPLTALRLRLEELGSVHPLPPDVLVELRQAVADVDRIDAELAELLRERAVRARRDAARTDVAAILDGVVRRWTERLAPLDRAVVVATPTDAVTVEVPAFALTAILDGILGATLRSCRGDVALDVEATTGHVRIRLRFPSTGSVDATLGLSDEALGCVPDQVHAAGGRLVLADGRCGVDVLLPRVHPSVA
jgi:signal transduction histidine kinase